MSGWTDILQDIKQRHPFLSQLEVCGSQGFSSELPEALQASFDIAENLRCGDPDHKRLAIIFPLLLYCPEWIAVVCSLSAVKQEFLPTIGNLAPFSPGQKLLLDGRFIVEYVRQEIKYGDPFIVVRMSAKSKAGEKPTNTEKWFRINEILRFQPTETRRPLTPIQNVVSQSDHLLDRLLDIRSFGNRSIFTNEVVLVSRLTKVRQFAEKTHIVNPASPEQSVSLRDLFQWGGITVEGELEQWGHEQIDAEPVIGVAPDLITLREYLSDRQRSDILIILDSRLPFANDLQALDEILDEGFSILVLMEQGNMYEFSHLENRGFKTWTWSASALRQLKRVESSEKSKPEIPFHIFNRTVRNYRVRQIQSISCDLSVLDGAAEMLQAIAKRLQSDDPELNNIVAKSYRILLNLSRLLRPLCIDNGFTRDKILGDLERVKSDVESKSIWLDKTDIVALYDLLKAIRAVLVSPSNISQKIDKLEGDFKSRPRNIQTAIVVADASEVSITEDFWRENVPRRRFSDSHFVALSELRDEREYDRVVVCGWLGASRMRQLYDSCIAPSITVLTYAFEKTWLRSAVSRWCSQTEKYEKAELSIGEKAKIFETNPVKFEKMHDSRVRTIPAENRKTTFDIEDFELRLRTYRRNLYANPSVSGETTTEAHFVAFSRDTMAYLRPNHKMPVVTDFITGHADESAEIPSRDVSQLNVGDYVMFREGSDSDLLRDLADGALDREGKGDLRRVAGLWKKALKKFVSEHPGGLVGALVELENAGLKRTEITIRGWLSDEHRIGPLYEKDVEIIARVSGSQDLKQQLDYVRRAISEVRGAHRQAARFLAQKLIAQVPFMLQQGIDESHTIEIEDIGRAFVVRIEDVDEDAIEVPISHVNCLLQGEF
ncbi:MAG: DrmE family protein [Gemmatimonadota bacterium]|nr:DrmE family protein [Gemmatimonadota bacterium]